MKDNTLWKVKLKGLRERHNRLELGLDLPRNQELLVLVRRFVDMRTSGAITEYEFDTLIKLLISNYVEHKIESHVDDILEDKLTDLCTASYA